MDNFAKNLSFKEIKTQLEDIKSTYKGIGNIEGIEKINTFMQQLYPSVLSNNEAFKSLINTTNESFGEGFSTNLQNILLGVREPISDTEILTNKLKEVESQLRACGETAKANKIKEYMQETQKKTIDVNSSINELRVDIEKCFGTDAVNDFNKKLNQTDNKVKSISKGSSFGSNLKTALGIGTVALGIRKAVGFLQDATTESIDFVETQNLFNVSMGKTIDQYGNLDKEASKYYTKAMAFQNKLSDKLKINIEESMEYQALFNAMSKSMGIGDEPSYKISENFTKLGYDLSSLYNIDPENAMQKLRAGLSGQTKPLRDLGLDITQQSLEPLLDELGIERSTKQLSQAEKMIARYIVVLRQASIAHGDFAKTMDSPANQLRIFNAQITAFKRNMGNLWQGLLGNILPYINAIMMVINELLKMVAKLFGFEVSDQNVNISAGIGADDLADDLDTASGKAKELKKQLMGFDEINNITLPDKSSGGSGGASVGGIDQKLLDAMKEYDNMMDKVKSKATDIKNQIMKWLGFTGDTNKDMKILKGYLDKIKAIAKVILGFYIGSKLLKLVGYLRTLRSVFLGTKAPMTSFQNGLALVGKGASNLKTYLKLGVEQFKLYRNAGDGVTKSLAKTGKEMFNLIPNTVKVAGGIAGLVGTSVLAYKSMEDLKNGTIGANEAMLKLVGSIAGATASGALIGSVFGPAGAVIGALTGLLISGTSALQGYNNVNKDLRESIKSNGEAISESTRSIKERTEVIQESINSQVAELSYYKNLTGELENLTETNGKVKTGYEDRVKFILNQLNEAFGTEYELTNGRITQNGKLVESIKGITDSIYKTIEAKKVEIILNANEEEYAKYIQESTKLYQEKENAIKNCKDAQGELTKILEKYGLTIEDYTNNTYKYQKALVSYSNIWTQDLSNAIRTYEEGTAKVEESTKNWTKCCKAITDFENLKTATITENQEEVDKALQEITRSYETETGIQTQTIGQQVKQVIELTQYKKERIIEIQGEINKETQESLDANLKAVADNLVQQTNTITTLGKDEIEAWRKLAEGSEQIYNEKISNVEEDTRIALEAVLNKVDINSPEFKNKMATMAIESTDKYNNILSKMPKDTREKIESAINEIKAQSGNAYNASYEVGNSSSKGIDDGSGDWNKKGKDNANGFAKGIRSAIGNVQNAAKDMVNASLQSVAQAQLSHSPSKKTRQLGIYNGEGFVLGIKEMIPEAIKNAKDLALSAVGSLHDNLSTEGIMINPNDFKIDTNQFIDYGQIKGAIATQNNINISSDIEGRIENAIYKGLSNATIPVEIEATTDEGVIFKKVQVKAREFYTQTGEPAFDF